MTKTDQIVAAYIDGMKQRYAWAGEYPSDTRLCRQLEGI